MKIELEDMIDLEIPHIIKNKLETRKDIDVKISKEYLKKYSKEEFYDNHNYLSKEYESMDKEHKKKALKTLGYRDDAIIEMLDNNIVGVNAYVVGHQKELQEGILLQFDLQQGEFSDKINSLEIDLDTSKEMSLLREELDNLINEYDKEVDKANKKINDAIKVKEEYHNIILSIRNNSGDDPNNWMEEEKIEYNNIVKKYNDIVIEANILCDEVSKLEIKYNSVKNKYKRIKKEFGEEFRNFFDTSIKE